MKTVRYDGSDERHAVAALAISTPVLSKAYPVLGESPFGSKWANLVARWCVQHFERYGEAPGPKGLQVIFDTWKEKPDDDTVAMAADFLTELPLELEMSNEYALDLVQKVIRKAAIKRLGTGLSAYCDAGRYDDAQSLLDSWSSPDISEANEGIFPLEDERAIEEAFNISTSPPLIQYEGDLGQFINPVLCRDAFVSFVAPEKTGKTTVLTDLAFRGVEAGCRVAVFAVGDMSQGQMLARLSPRLCKRPIAGGHFSIPRKLEYTDKEPTLTRTKHIAKAPTMQEVKDAWASYRGENPKRFRLMTYPAGTICARDIQNKVRNWSSAGWVPDIIVIDYADILAGPPGIRESIEQITKNWETMRAMSTEQRCLVVTATQATREGYSAWLLTKKDVSDCKKKVANVTAMIGLNMTEEEKQQGICRYNYVALREAEFMQDYPSCVGVAGCTRVGRPSLISAWVR